MVVAAVDRDWRAHYPHSKRDASKSSMCSGTLVSIPLLLLLGASAFLLAGHAGAEEATPPPDDACAQTRLVLVRSVDGQPAPGVRVTLSAVSPEMGGPGIYSSQGSIAPKTESRDDQDAPVSPLATPGIECTPVITGTLTATTDRSGLAQFSRLGEGNWMLRFDGEVARGSEIASVVSASIQGLFPFGRTREGGGFVERVDALNEHAPASLIPNPEPVQPGTGATTSRYVLQYSAEHGGWLPGIDLAAGDDAPPVPLAAVAPVSGDPDGQQSDSAAESSFDPSAVEEASRWDQATAQPAQQPESTDLSTVWWVVALVLAGGALPVMWRMRRYVA